MAVRRFNARPNTDYSTASPLDFDRASPGGQELKFYLCDTFVELPPSNLNPGDQAYVISNNTFWIAINSTTWSAMGPNTGSSLTIQEEDGSPLDAAVTKLRFPNGSLIVNSVGDLSVIFTGAVATDNIWDAVGDIVVGTGANTAARLAPNTTVTKKFFSEITSVASWEVIADADVPLSHSGSTHAATQAAAEATAAGALSGHVIAADPHTGYRLESDNHSHQSIGLQAGKLDHGLALDGLGDDDHAAYLLAADATSRSAFTTNWLDLTDSGATTLHSHASSSPASMARNFLLMGA